MAYTVETLYKKVLEGADKMGSDFYPLDVIMNKLVTATHDFIGETVKFMENTQEIRDDIRTLYKPYKLGLVEDPNDSDFKVMALPEDYQHLMSAKVIDSENTVRKTRIIRHGQLNIYQNNPNKKATAEYPIIVLYADYLRVISPGSPTHVSGFYVKEPAFGKYGVHDDISSEIAVDIPEFAADKIIKTIINDIFVSTGDPRAVIQYEAKETYRKRSK
jgi:hypothetical protein